MPVDEVLLGTGESEPRASCDEEYAAHTCQRRSKPVARNLARADGNCDVEGEHEEFDCDGAHRENEYLEWHRGLRINELRKQCEEEDQRLWIGALNEHSGYE